MAWASRQEPGRLMAQKGATMQTQNNELVSCEPLLSC